MTTRPRDPQQQITAAARDRIIVQRRAAKVSFTAIGDELGISGQRVYQLWSRILDRIPAQQLNEHRREELILAEQAQRELLLLAADPTASARSRAEVWTAVRGWSEYRAKLLGLFAPTRNEVTVITEDVITAAIREAEAQLAEAETLDRAESLLSEGPSQ